MSIVDTFNTLNEQQHIMFHRMMDVAINKKQKYLVIDAPGGTGKTYVAKNVMQFVQSYGMKLATVSFTGKATGQLSKSGIMARTCHSLLYTAKLDDKGNLIGFVSRDIGDIRSEVGEAIIVDEASMIPKELHLQMSRIGVPIIYLGDSDQLPPVDNKNPDFNIMKTLDCEKITLTKTERFEEDSGIGWMCSHLRKENSIPRRKMDGLSMVSKAKTNSVEWHRDNQFDAVLCGTNNMRTKMNSVIRSARGFFNELPERDEIIICLRNDVVGGTQIFNGETFRVMSAYEEVYNNKTPILRLYLESQDYVDKKLNVVTTTESWYTEKSDKRLGQNEEDPPLQLFTYGYCISVHKSQGSTIPNVLFIDQDVSFFLDQRRFRYTACSRASESLTVAI